VHERCAGVIGASSIVGERLLPLLVETGWTVEAFSRTPHTACQGGATWYQIGARDCRKTIPYWVSLAPVWVLPDYFDWMEERGIRRIVALSSTSRFTKVDSADGHEQVIAKRLAEAEDRIAAWAAGKGVDWCVLRPTMIYGLGRDSNISEIARMIRRYRIFPLLGRATGLRQPVHADDVAQACLAGLSSYEAAARSYNLSGGETLTYRAMVERVFTALDRGPRFVSLPLSLFRFGMALLRLLPRYRHWNAAMAERMNRDLVFDHSEAARDLGFRPRRFELRPEDLPQE
jgi:nucleoside-diphosphate-sugar epimerase